MAKKVSETAEMLNMLNFCGFLEFIGYLPYKFKKNPKNFNVFNISPVSLTFSHQSPPSLTLQLRESFFDFHSCNVKLWGPKGLTFPL